MTIKINVGVNKKIGLPDYGSAGGHCNIEIEADNSILDNADQFLQRVQDAYELARQSVEKREQELSAKETEFARREQLLAEREKVLEGREKQMSGTANEPQNTIENEVE